MKEELRNRSDKVYAERLQGFFKTGRGEYGEGDKFLGVRVPDQRKLAKRYQDIPRVQVVELLSSPIHEHRLTAIFILTYQFNKGDQEARRKIVETYLDNLDYINNWDLVDSSAPKILGEYLVEKPRDSLYELAGSCNLWERRISIIATFAFIKRQELDDSIALAKILLDDEHDLIHKAVGWVLREVGKSDQQVLEDFLEENIGKMPRTMLRYAIEKLPEEKRQYYMSK
ncbi:DNA alkylation repair protein [Candidatus Bathyarchaeota archaeon]|nr:DNA alkylation repair protein [Candidatus Bathyarchaeota archaeon]